MAELLKVSTLITVSADEVSRANAAFSQIDALNVQVAQLVSQSSQLTVQINALNTENVALKATVKDLQAKLDALVTPTPIPNPPTPVPPVQGARTGLFVDGTKIRTRNGAEIRLRCIEVMVNGNAAGYGYSKLLQQLKTDIGANAVSPLFQGTYGSTAEVKKFCDAALALNMVVGVNADHQTDGRAWLCKPDLVALLNSYPHVYLVCEVETYADGDTTAAWATGEKNKIKALRDAGHNSMIKAGTHGGGRDVMYPLAKGAEVLAYDTKKNVAFTTQFYWKAAAGGWNYPEANGFSPSGVEGTKNALKACVASGLCFIPGFDFKDNVGLTGEDQLLDMAQTLGMSCAHWAATGDGSNPENNLYDWDFKPSQPPKPMAALLATKFLLSRSAFPDPVL